MHSKEVINENELVSILILNWNREKETLRAIESAHKQSYKNIEIVIVDNGSTDTSVTSIRKKYPKIKLINLSKNFGCPGGRNRGINYCEGKLIFFLDNDGVLHEDAVANAVKAIKSDPNCVVVTGQIYDFCEEKDINTSFQINFDEKNILVKSFQGGISLHRKSLFNFIGFYPDDYIYGGEEQYLSLLIHEKKKNILKNNSVILWHKKSNVARDRNREEIQAMMNTFITYYSLLPWYLFLIFSLKYIFYYPIITIRKKNVSLFIKRNISELPKRILSIERKPISLRTFLYQKKLPDYDLFKNYMIK